MSEKDLDILIALGRLGATMRYVELTTDKLGSTLDISQQTASRKIIELEESGFLLRSPSKRGYKLRLTEKALTTLRDTYASLKSVLEGYSPEKIEGVVVSGSGEGAYYVRLGGYRDQFKKVLGIDPYPGTLNIRVDPETRDRVKTLFDTMNPVRIRGFEQEGRTFGEVMCLRVMVEDLIEAAIITPLRSHHPENIIEIVSNEYFRSKLKLNDGDKLVLRII